MKIKRQEETRYYDPFIFPPRHMWNLDLTIKRREIAEVLEVLESLVYERGGAWFYFPNRENGSTTCRFEWHLKRRNFSDLLRVGVVIVVRTDRVDNPDCFLSTNKLVQKPWRKLPAFSDVICEAAREDIVNILSKALKIARTDFTDIFYVVDHVKMGGVLVLGSRFDSPDDTVRILPTVIARDRTRTNDRISPVIFTIRAPTGEIAKKRAHRRLAFTCAIATLTTSTLFEPARVSWTRKRPRPRLLKDPNTTSTQKLYPNHIVLRNKEKASDVLPAVIREIWNAYLALAVNEREMFEQALFAYYGAMEVRRKQPTVAVVSFIACLNLLASKLIDECPGILTCSEHGTLPWKHKTKGDRVAIIDFVSELLGFPKESNDYRDFTMLISRIYNKQRSAFVHGAELRHGEYGDKDTIPSVRPGPSSQYSTFCEYAFDLDSIASIVRRVLWAWLEHASNRKIDPRQFEIESSVLKFRPMEFAGHVSRKPVVSRFQPWRDGELEIAAQKDFECENDFQDKDLT